MINLLRYMIWRGGQGEPTTDVGETELVLNVEKGTLMFKKPSKYIGTTFSLTDGDLTATAPTGADVEDLEIDEDGYVVLTESA